MIYQLERFEEWIRTEIALEIVLQDFSDTKLKEYIDFATREKERVCGYFRDKAITGESSAHTMKLIEAHQVGINTAIDGIIAYTKAKEFDLPPKVVSFYFRVCQVIEDIAKFLFQHLPEFFNKDLPISYVHAMQSKVDLRKQLETLQPLAQNPGMDRQLFRMITRPFREFVDEDKSLSYRDLTYLKELMAALRRLLDYDHEDVIYEVHFTLMQLNFNYPRYVLYYSYWLDGKLSELSSRIERLDKLSWHLHAIEQVQIQPGCVWIPGLPSVTDQLLASIKNTYQYLLEKNQNVNHAVIDQIERASKPKNDKIKLAVSVPVLALFLKSLIKAGIIVNENKAEVFRAMAENFSTLKADNISYDSLKGKFNKTPPSAHVHLKKTLTKILDSMRKI